MHIPDGFLDAKTALGTGAAGVAGLAIAVRHVRASLPPQKVPLLGLGGAFIFAAQMLNFPVLGGTSGHLVGATLAALLLGPSAAVIVMTAVLLVQCLVFADGGVTALGANVFNMAIVAPLVGFASARTVQSLLRSERGLIAGAAFGAWCSIVAAAISCAAQLALSGIAQWRMVFPAMAGIHMVIGLGEGLITALVLTSVLQLRPELLDNSDHELGRARAKPILVALAAAVGLAALIGPFASSLPDGLEKVAETLGFAAAAAPPPIPGLLSDRAAGWLKSSVVRVGVVGALGTLLAFGFSVFVARLLAPGRRRNAGPNRKLFKLAGPERR